MIRNFLFHRVSPDRDPLWDPMDIAHFDKCIRYISSKYKVLPFEDLVNDKAAMASKNKYATIMFDDGYKDNIEYAFPILEKYGVKASFYVVTDCIDRNVPTWTHILEYSFQHTSQYSLQLDFDFLPQEYREMTASSVEDKLSFASKLKPFLKKIDHDNRNQVLASIQKQFADVHIPEFMMNWNDLKILLDHGHKVQSHTVYHSMLGTIKDESVVRMELKESSKRIYEMLGYYPETISYPVGSYDETTKRLSEEVGYSIGLAVKQDAYIPSRDGLFEVARIELYNEAWWKTKLRISNRLEQFKKLIRYR